jgi:hypothetical protein
MDKIMKKILGYLGTHFFYYLANFISIFMIRWDLSFLYPSYKNLINISLTIQDWAHLEKPWKESSQNDFEKD